MSFSLRVTTHNPVELDIEMLRAGIVDLLRFLLNQGREFSPCVEMFDGEGLVKGKIAPGPTLYTLDESKYLGYGLMFSYDLYEYWETHSSMPEYSFTVHEIPKRKDDLALVFSIAACLAVARRLDAGVIEDSSGQLSRADEVSVGRVTGVALRERMPLSDALRTLYERLPLGVA